MKRQPRIRTRFLKGLTRRSAFALFPIAVMAGTGSLKAASATYTGASGGVFDTGTNWNPNGAPGSDSGSTTAAPSTTNNTDTALFSNAATSVTFTDTRNLGSITFSQTSGTFTVGATTGPALYLSDGGSITKTTNAVTFAEPIMLEGSYTFANNEGASGSHAFTFGGASNGGTLTEVNSGTLTLSGTTPSTVTNIINSAITGSLAINKAADTSTWQFNSTSNTFSGGLTVNGGTVSDGGVGNTTRALGSGTITLGGATVILNTNGTGSSANVVNNALVTGATTNSFLYRYSGGFNPASLTGTGTLNFSVNTANASAAITTTGTSFGAYGGTINLNGSSSTLTNTVTMAAAALTNTTGTVNVNTNAILTSAASSTVTSGSALAVAGGTLNLGGTSVGMLTLTSNKTFSMTSGTLDLTLSTLSSFDKISASGSSTFSLSSGSTIDLTGATTNGSTETFQVFSGFSSGTVGTVTFTDVPSGYTASLDSTGLLTLAVPEPGTFVQMGCLALVGLAFAGKRRWMAAR